MGASDGSGVVGSLDGWPRVMVGDDDGLKVGFRVVGCNVGLFVGASDDCSIGSGVCPGVGSFDGFCIISVIGEGDGICVVVRVGDGVGLRVEVAVVGLVVSICVGFADVGVNDWGRSGLALGLEFCLSDGLSLGPRDTPLRSFRNELGSGVSVGWFVGRSVNGFRVR